MVILCLTSPGATELLSIVTATFHIPNYNVQGFRPSPTLAGFWFFDYNLPSERKVLSHCGLICIPLMINDVEHLFGCLLAIWITSLGKCLFKSFPHFYLGALCFYG